MSQVATCETFEEYASRAATEDATELVQAVRNADGPICHVTSNAYFPPLREVGRADEFYSGSFWNPTEAWAVYVETFESVLQDEDVFMDSPEWDNFLYCVDLKRFEYVDEDERTQDEELSDEWRAIVPASR